VIYSLSIEEEKQILIQQFTKAAGKHRELLDLMIDAYPNALSASTLQKGLATPGYHAFQSTLRNAQIFIQVKTHQCNNTNQMLHSFDTQAIERVRVQRLLNQCSCF
jgi:hypothetical protein